MEKVRFKKPPKLNLIPILDSVFIFIFFLLMSAQFVDVYEIGSSLPVIQEVPAKAEKDPFNLTLEVSKEKVIVKSGTLNEVTRTFEMAEKEKLRAYLTELKIKNPSENTMIFKAGEAVPFQVLINVMDNTRAPAEAKDSMFEQVVFDNKGVQ